MKYIKKAPITRSDPMSDRFSVQYDDEIVTNTKRSMLLPKGTTDDRPGTYVDGMIRYNLDLHEFEVYNGTTPGTGWEKVRTVRQAPITVQALGPGNYAQTVFGPLQYSTGEYYSDYSKPQNILVFIENVFQIPTVNYTLAQSGNRVNIVFNEPPPTKYIYALLGYDGNFPPFPAP